MITLKDCWSQLSKHIQQQMMAHHPDLLGSDDFLERLTDPAYWRTYRKLLCQDEETVIHWLTIRRGEDWLSFRELQSEPLPLPSSVFRLALTKLRQRGIVYAGRQAWGETFYVMPADLRAAWLQTELPDKIDLKEGVTLTSRANPGLHHDLFHLLVMLDRDNATLTGQGVISKRDVQKMNAELETPEEAFREAGWPAKGTAVTSFHIVYHFAERVGLLQVKDGEIVAPHTEALLSWIKQSHHDMAHVLYDLVKDEMLKAHPHDAAVLWWMEEQTGWVPLRDMALYWLRQFGQSEKEWETLADRWTATCIEPLHGLGWIDWGECVSGAAWRWSAASPFAEAAEPLPTKGYVQPNFEWLLPISFPFEKRWQAAQFADLMQTDQMCTYEINAESVKRGVKKGWTAERMLQFLQDNSFTPVPQNVEVSIREWENSAGRVKFTRVILLTCGDKHLAEELYKHSDIQPLLGRQLNETDYVIQEQHIGRLSQLLEQAGYTSVSIGDLASTTSSDNLRDTNQSNRSRCSLRIDNRYPELEEAVPGLAGLPKLWTSDMREYHPSTLLQLIGRALDMQLELERHVSDKARDTFRPTRLTNTSGAWQVEGIDSQGQKRLIHLSDIGRIRIKIPVLG